LEPVLRQVLDENWIFLPLSKETVLVKAYNYPISQPIPRIPNKIRIHKIVFGIPCMNRDTQVFLVF
jgi:hypothetical protein